MVTKLKSQPQANDGKLGKVEVELSSSEVRTKIMKTKKVLEHHSNDTLKNLRIHNKKTQEQINQEFTNRQLLRMIPGGHNWYIAGNGQLRQQQRPARNSLHPGYNHQYPPPPPQAHSSHQACNIRQNLPPQFSVNNNQQGQPLNYEQLRIVSHQQHPSNIHQPGSIFSQNGASKLTTQNPNQSSSEPRTPWFSFSAPNPFSNVLPSSVSSVPCTQVETMNQSSNNGGTIVANQ